MNKYDRYIVFNYPAYDKCHRNGIGVERQRDNRRRRSTICRQPRQPSWILTEKKEDRELPSQFEIVILGKYECISWLMFDAVHCCVTMAELSFRLCKSIWMCHLRWIRQIAREIIILSMISLCLLLASMLASTQANGVAFSFFSRTSTYSSIHVKSLWSNWIYFASNCTQSLELWIGILYLTETATSLHLNNV